MLTKFDVPHLLWDFDQCNFGWSISDDVKWFLIKDSGNNNSSCMIISHQCCSLHCTSCLFWSLPHNILLYNTRWGSIAWLLYDTLHEYLGVEGCWQTTALFPMRVGHSNNLIKPNFALGCAAFISVGGWSELSKFCGSGIGDVFLTPSNMQLEGVHVGMNCISWYLMLLLLTHYSWWHQSNGVSTISCCLLFCILF